MTSLMTSVIQSSNRDVNSRDGNHRTGDTIRPLLGADALEAAREGTRRLVVLQPVRVRCRGKAVADFRDIAELGLRVIAGSLINPVLDLNHKVAPGFGFPHLDLARVGDKVK